MADIAVIADRITAELFLFTDFHIKSIDEKDDVTSVLTQFCQKKYKIIYITETLANEAKDKINELQKKCEAIIVTIPGIDTNRKNLSENKSGII